MIYADAFTTQILHLVPIGSSNLSYSTALELWSQFFVVVVFEAAEDFSQMQILSGMVQIFNVTTHSFYNASISSF